MLPFFRTFILLILALDLRPVHAQSFWEPLDGPNGIQAINAFLPDASGRLFINVNDKIYRSDDTGDSWVECMGGLAPSLYMEKFLASPSGAFYLSLQSGSTVFRYNAATDVWSPLTLPSSQWGYYDGADIDLQGRLWVTSNNSDNEIYYSVNEGQSFQKIPLTTPITGWFEGLATYNDEHNLMVANDQVYHLKVDGENQVVLDKASPLIWIGYNPYNGTAYYSDYDVLKRSADGGLTWEEVKIALVPFQPRVSKITFETGGRTWAHTSSGMYWSDDDGLTWEKDTVLGKTGGNFFRGAGGDWFVSNLCTFPNFARSGDNGSTWTDLSQQFQLPTVLDIKKDGTGALYARTCQYGAYEKSVDGGQSWNSLIIHDSAEVRVSSLAARPDGVMMAAGDNKKNYRSLNNGASWEEMPDFPPPSPVTSYYYFYTDYLGAFYAFELYSNAWKSTDNGDSWQQIPLGGGLPQTSFSFHPNGDVFFTDAANSGVFVANTDTIHWLGNNANPFFDANQVHCTTTGITYLAALPFSGNTLFRILPDANYFLEPVPYFGNSYVSAITSNAEGDVFVVANDGLYRSEDDGQNWESLGSMPGKGYLKTLYVTPNQYLYAGYDGDVIYRSAQPTAENNFIFGKVWLDNDGDCQYDAGEAFQSSVAVTATGNGDYTAFSGYSGHFILSAPSGNYALDVQPPNALYEPCQPGASVTLNGPNDSATVDLPLRAVVQCPYLSVSLTTPILRRCFDITYTVRYKNEGTAVAEDAYVQVTLDSFFVYQSSTLPAAAQNGFTYTFNLGDLAPGQSGSFNLAVQVSCDASLGQTHCISAEIYPNQLCLPALPPLAFYRECRENTGSFDPNDKRAFVEGREDPGSVLPDTDIEYLIRFQNTGTDTAFRVVVEDRFSALLDLASVTPLVASHPYTMEVKDQRVLRFVFDNILLPDSNINEAASHGFIKFRVSQAPNLPPGSVIRNEADIFFDYNAPVRTNESKLVVGLTATRPEPGNPYTVSAYPNPFGEAVTFEVEGPALSGTLTLRLFDALGRQVRREEFAGTKFSLERAALETGLYYFLIESEGKRVGAGKVEAK